MQGQRNSNTMGSFTESGDFNRGSAANNAGSSQQASSSNILNPLERVSSSMASPSESSYANASGHDVRNSTSWHYGEPSSRMNLQNQMNDDGIRREHGWMSLNSAFVGPGPSVAENRFAPTSSHYSGRINNIGSSSHQVTSRPLFSEGSSVNHSPTYVNSNAGSLGGSSRNEGYGMGSGVGTNIYRPGGLEREQTTSDIAMGTSSGSSNYISGNSGGPASLSSYLGSSCKRMALEGTSEQSYDGGSSSCFPQSENDTWHTTPARYGPLGSLNLPTPVHNPPSVSPLEQQNSRFGSGNRGVPANANSPLGVGSSAESIQRNSSRIIILGRQQESVPLNLSSSIYSPHHLPRQGLYRESPGQRPSAAVASAASSSNVHQRQARSMHISDRSRTAHPWQIDPNLRVGNSSSFPIAGDRRTSTQEEANIRIIPRSSTDHLMFSPVAELRNLTPDATNWNLDGGNVNNSGGFSYSSSVAPSNAWSSPSRPLSHNPRRLPEIAPWPLLPPPPLDSDPGGHVSAFLPTASNAADLPSNTTAPSRVNSQSRHQAHRRAIVLLERRNNDRPRSVRILAANVDGRLQLTSEIRQVLSAMRRGENFRAEAAMQLNPRILHGMVGIHDRHGDMRLDVDNMSYEELLELGERIGDVSTGLDERTILKRMRQREYYLMDMKPQEDMEPCCVCQECYADGDYIGTLHCGHDFHTDCIKQWLKQKNLCPICKTTALPKEKDQDHLS